MERATPINPEAQFDKAFEAAVKVLAAAVLEAGKGRSAGKGRPPAKRRDVYPPEPNDVYPPEPNDVYPPEPNDVYPPEPNDVYPPEPNKPCKLIEEVSHSAHVSHHAARVAIGHAARAFHTTSIAVLVAKCPGNPD
jgi:hypothetical protein